MISWRETVEKREEEEERWIVVSTLGCHAMLCHAEEEEVARPPARPVALDDLFMSCKTNGGGCCNLCF